MTTLGKVLVFVNLGLSLMMATWAQGMYSSRIDFTNKTGKDITPDGTLVARIARVKELGAALAPGATSWNLGRATLGTLDTRREAARRWYEAELTFLQTGANQANPARRIKQVNGQPAIFDPPQPNGQAVAMQEARDRLGRPLLGFAAYDQATTDGQSQLDAASKNLTQLIQEDTQLTGLLVGDQAAPKGLQQRILEERAKVAGVMAEIDFIQALLINDVVNSDLVYKRQRALEARIRELEKVASAR